MYHAQQLNLFQRSKKSLKEQFEEFDQKHPDIWDLFVKRAFDLINQGHKHYSADGILHVIRFHYDTSTKGHSPKICNNWSALYSRKWAQLFPNKADFFSRRTSQVDQ